MPNGKIKYMPRIIEWDLTYRCPQSCVHCYQENLKKGFKNEMSTEQCFKTIDMLNRMGAVRYIISGGDPLIRKDSLKILQKIKGTSRQVTLLTTGMLLTRHICQELWKMNIDKVEITLLGTDALTHDENTGVPGSFSKTIHSIELLKAQQIPIRLKFIFMKNNLHQLDSVELLSKKLQLSIDHDPYLWCKIFGNENEIQTYRLTPQEQIQYFRKYPKMPIRKNFFPCSAGRYKLALTPAGDILPCGAFSPEYAVGNIIRENIDEVWNNSKMLEKLRKMMRFPIGKCRKCAQSDFCNICFAQGTWSGISISEPYPAMCEYAHSALLAKESD